MVLWKYEIQKTKRIKIIIRALSNNHQVELYFTQQHPYTNQK